MKPWFTHTLPGAALIVMGFWVGTQPNLFLALIGFLSFFVMGITMIMEGRKK